jgi:predicted nucleotide-binding protein (sugar kinase/HSP70/actin superfamily)
MSKAVKQEERKIVSFPHMGDYHIPFKVILKRIFKGWDVLVPPPVTAKTLEIGSLHSPDFVCVPFKYTLGNAIEAAENGANVVVHAGGAGDCRVGFYGELQEKILKDLGHNVKVVNPFPGLYFNPFVSLKVIRNAGAKAPLLGSINTALAAIRMIQVMDKIDDFRRANECHEVVKGSFEKLNDEFMEQLKTAKWYFGVNRIYKKYLKKFKALEIKRPEKPIRVLIIGEVYVVMEPFSNYHLEKQLAGFGIEVTRHITLSNLMKVNYKSRQKLLKLAPEYMKYDITSDGLSSVAHTLEVAKKGYDGVIHLKPFGCLPEVSAMPMLSNITRDYGIPVLYFSLDSTTSETGAKTRLEAFYDMMTMKRDKVPNTEGQQDKGIKKEEAV